MIKLMEDILIHADTGEIIYGYYWESEETAKGAKGYTSGSIYKDGYPMLLSKNEYHKHAERRWAYSRMNGDWLRYTEYSLKDPVRGHMRKHYLRNKYKKARKQGLT